MFDVGRSIDWSDEEVERRIHRYSDAHDRFVRTADTSNPKPGRPALSETFLEDVAAYWHRRNAAGSRHPNKDIAERFHGSESAAAKWVFKARKAGLIPPAEKKGQS